MCVYRKQFLLNSGFTKVSVWGTQSNFIVRYRVDETTLLKSFYRDDPNDHHTRTHRKHTSPVGQPCYQSRNSRKHRLKYKMQSPDELCHSPSNIVKIESTTSSITFNEEKHQTMTTWSRTSYSLASSATESNTKLNLTKKYGKSMCTHKSKKEGKLNLICGESSMSIRVQITVPHAVERSTQGGRDCIIMNQKNQTHQPIGCQSQVLISRISNSIQKEEKTSPFF